jgi:hypothetical protein
VQEEVMTWFRGQAAEYYDKGIQKLIPRLNNVCTMPPNVLRNSYVKAIQSRLDFVN